MRQPAARAYLVLLLMPLFVASNVNFGRPLLETVSPWTLACLRWSITALVLLPFAWRPMQQHAEAIASQWRRFALLGFLGMWVCGGIVYMSLTVTTATHATLIYTSSPVMVVVLAAVLARQMLPVSQILGVAMAAIGVIITAVAGDFHALTQLQFNLGDLGMVVCSISWAIYSLVLKYRSFEAIPIVTSFFIIAACGSIMLMPCMIYELLTIGGFPASLHAWTLIAGIVIVSSLLSFSSFQYGVRMVGPSVTSVFMYLSPIYGVAIAVAFLGEAFRPYHAVGLGLILCGVVLATSSNLLAAWAYWRRRPLTQGARR